MPVDFSTPLWLMNYYGLIGTFSLMINFGTIYLILFKSDKMDSFRYFLLTFQVICTITDFHLTILMQPVPLFPIVAGYCNGILVKVFNVYAHYLMISWTSLIVAQVSALVFCFAWKHRIISKVTSRSIPSDKIYVFGAIFSITTPIFMFLSSYQMGINRNSQMEYVKQNYPQYIEEFSKLKNFSIYEIDERFIIVILISAIGSCFSGFTFTFTTIDMFKLLRGLKTKVSEKRFRLYQSAVRSLLAQFATSSLCLAPPCAVMIIVVGKFENGQIFVQIAFAITALHSLVNAMVLIMTTLPYRQFVLGQSSKVFGVKITS